MTANPVQPGSDGGGSVAFVTTLATLSQAFPAGYPVVYVWATQACFIEVGENPNATVNSLSIPANDLVPVVVPAGSGAPWKVSAMAVSNAGSLQVKPGY